MESGQSVMAGPEQRYYTALKYMYSTSDNMALKTEQLLPQALIQR